MKKLSFLFALLCASVMAFAYTSAPDTWIGTTDATYASQFKWYTIDGVATPNDVVNIQKPGFASEIGIYVTFADAGFNAVYYNDVLKANNTHYKQDGAGIVFFLSALTEKTTQIILKNGETVRFGLTIYNDKGAEPIESEYCGYEGDETKSGDTYVTLTWETLANGNVEITMGTGTGATSCAFRNGGFEGGIDAFVVSTDDFETTTAASEYFTAEKVYSGNVFTLVKIADVPAGAKIKHVGGGSVNAFSWTVNGASAWGWPDFIYTYGGVCASSVFTDIKLSASATIAKVGDAVTLNVKAVDQNGLPMENIDIELSVSPEDAGAIVDDVFTFAKVCNATITATSGTISNEIILHGVPSDNLALNKTCKGGYYDNNPEEADTKVNDGNASTAWVTYANQPASVEWWYVDLGTKYNIAAINLIWAQNYSNNYILQVRDEAPEETDESNDEAWETIATVTTAEANSETFSSVVGAGRYLRFHSLSRPVNHECIRLRELQVYGTEWVDEGDTEKPVMESATLESKTWNSAVIAVEATDNKAVAKFHVVNADPAIDVKLIATDGKITVTGLTPATEYNFTITALDAALNESENNKSVEVTTDGHLFAPDAAATAPTVAAAQVKAIYSPTYEANCIFAEWGSGTTYTQDTYGKKFVMANGGYFGMEGFNFDCTDMEKLHYDIWIDIDATLRIVPILRHLVWNVEKQQDEYTNYTEYGETVNLVGQQWNSIDLVLADGNLASYTDWTETYQVKIDNAANLTIWVGNAYFYTTKSDPTAIDNTVEAVKAVKMIENGQLIIIKNGIRYNVAGQIVK